MAIAKHAPQLVILLTAGLALAQTQTPPAEPVAQPALRNIGTMSQLMINIIYPTSDAIFYVDRNEPKTEVDWNNLANQSLMLAESANLLMMPGRARDQQDWLSASAKMREAGTTAFKAARAKDIEGIRNVNDQLYDSCVSCHTKYRPNYPRRPADPK